MDFEICLQYITKTPGRKESRGCLFSIIYHLPDPDKLHRSDELSSWTDPPIAGNAFGLLCYLLQKVIDTGILALTHGVEAVVHPLVVLDYVVDDFLCRNVTLRFHGQA